ncbi:MAG: hypothetical protein COB78_09980 [Hyphomicrobiales bacterium]|nr:MAG: hypothetical protein COB78_09980 [Hyphomicrobiales bacterium]
MTGTSLQSKAIDDVTTILEQSFAQTATSEEREAICEAVLASVAGALGIISVMRDEDNPSDMVKLAHQIVELYIAKQPR